MTLRICVVLADGDAPGPGERRFLDTVSRDDRLSLHALTALPPPPSKLPAAFAGLLRAEARTLPAPDTAPALSEPIATFDAGSVEGCDVIVDFSHAEQAEALADKARFGLWRLSAFAEGAGLSEARLRSPATAVTLTCDRGKGPIPIASARYDTKFLATRNRAYAREKSVQLLARELVRLARADTLPRRITPPPPAPVPAAWDVVDYVFATAREFMMRAWRKVEAKRGRRPGMFFLRLGHGRLEDITLTDGVDLVPLSNSYWADPFLFEHGGRTYLFYEDYSYDTGRGHLSVGRLDGDTMAPMGPVMQRDIHLSYPFVFSWNGEILMIPETHQAERIEVWRATRFPMEWELLATGFEGVKAVDTVVFQRDGQWWLLTNICNDSFGDFGTELHLFRIDDPLLGGAAPHPLNPVVIDACTARGGGRIVERDGRLLRASQDNTHGIYGYGLNLMEITELSMESFAERPLRHLYPDDVPGVMGAHHMDAAGGYTVVDLRRTQTGLHRSGRRQLQDAAAQEDQHQGRPDDGGHGDGEAKAKLGAE
ncbi:hypothetical protein GQE99_05630 [Maritimibacter sp. DP07]|uniref:Glucosamine inositolphosphorylceramide transferase 1 N-terminal domain-containing protein n=1 Tax=Maritimibacter harenae TaxID=2606218 RepID=A0A845LYS1_9RHOB|nr:hypothetical protein [Maritimibacter harenae]MZR12496.1 hypothetical protein [Maritimibacter harenae]